MKQIVIYSFPEISPKQRIKFNRELYGFEDYSNNGNYKYNRKGILLEGEYEKPIRGVIILKTNIKRVEKHLKKYNAMYKLFKIA